MIALFLACPLVAGPLTSIPARKTRLPAWSSAWLRRSAFCLDPLARNTRPLTFGGMIQVAEWIPDEQAALRCYPMWTPRAFSPDLAIRQDATSDEPNDARIHRFAATERHHKP